MNRFLFACLFICSGAMHLLAQSTFEIRVAADTILAGCPLEVAFTLKGGASTDFSPPDFKGFRIQRGPNHASTFSMVNGNTSQSTTITYFLVAEVPGDVYIGPAFVKSGNQELETVPVKIRVLDNPDGRSKQYYLRENKMDLPTFDVWGDEFLLPPPPAPKPEEKKRKTSKL